MNSDQIISEAITAASSGSVERFTIESPDDVVKYIRLAGIGTVDPTQPAGTIPPLGSYTPDTDVDGDIIRHPDLLLLVTGLEDDFGGAGTAHLVRINYDAIGDIEVISLNNSSTDCRFGFTYGADGSYHLWLESAARRSTTTITVLGPSEDFDVFQEESPTEPVGISYLTPNRYWSNSNIATQSEAEAGANNTKGMTPLRVKEAIAAQASGAIGTHTSDTSNPHSVTKAQVGLGNVANYAPATEAEAEAGTADDKYMTPLQVTNALNANMGSDPLQAPRNMHLGTAAYVDWEQLFAIMGVEYDTTVGEWVMDGGVL